MKALRELEVQVIDLAQVAGHCLVSLDLSTKHLSLWLYHSTVLVMTGVFRSIYYIWSDI